MHATNHNTAMCICTSTFPAGPALCLSTRAPPVPPTTTTHTLPNATHPPLRHTLPLSALSNQHILPHLYQLRAPPQPALPSTHFFFPCIRHPSYALCLTHLLHAHAPQVLARCEDGGQYPVCTWLAPLQLGRSIATPRQAHRFVSLLQVCGLREKAKRT